MHSSINNTLFYSNNLGEGSVKDLRIVISGGSSLRLYLAAEFSWRDDNLPNDPYLFFRIIRS